MLAHIQMARLTCAAMFKGHGRPIPYVNWQNLLLERNKAGQNKRLNLQAQQQIERISSKPSFDPK